jgi:hypothetical protein
MKSEMESALLNLGLLRMSVLRASIFGVGADHTILHREGSNKHIGTPVIHL